MMEKNLCIFCGSRSGVDPAFTSKSLELADHYVKAGFDLVYGGGKYGLMGDVAARFLDNGRQVLGIRPNKLIDGEDAFLEGTTQIVVSDMFDRKKQMMAAADIFIALPGGIGTLDEIGDIYTQRKIGFVDKYCGVLNVNQYYSPFEQMLEKMVENDFLSSEQKGAIHFESDPAKLFENSYRWWKEKVLIDKIAYVKISDGKVLMTRSKGKEKYYIPGGKREMGEADVDTLIREVKEELDVSIMADSISYLGTFRAQADGRAQGVDVQMKCYEAAFQGDLLACSEIEELRWMNFHQIDSVAEVDKKIFHFLHEANRLR